MQNSVMIHNVTVDELYEKIRTTVRDEIIFQKSCETVGDKKFLTRRETATRLRITLPTLNTYTKQGVLTGVRFGYRVLYREEDVNAALKEIPTRKYKRAS
jgi:excisionase family DNA binding protein